MSAQQTQTEHEIADPEVQYKVDYSLDVVTHDLITSGQLSAAKSYALKSPEMKAHMGRQVMNLNRRRLANEESTSNKVTFKPLSTPIGLVAKISKESMPKAKSKGKKIANNNKSGNIRNAKTKFFPETTKATPSRSTRPAPSKAPVKISHSKTILLSTKHHNNEKSKSSKSVKILQPTSAGSNAQVQEAYWTKIDMKEFANEDISLDVQAHTITITGYRPRQGANNSRKVTEIVQIPDHIEMERLRIGRRADGALIIEENLQH